METEPTELNPATASVLRRFAARRTRLIWIRAFAVGLLSLATTMTIVMLIDYRWLLPTGASLLISFAGYSVTFAAMWWISLRHLQRNDRHSTAKQLESVDPRLRENLLSAVELSDPNGTNGSVEFRERLQRVVARRAAGMDVAKLLPMNLLKPWLTAASIVACITTILLLVPPLQIGRRVARAMLPGLPIERASLTQIEIISPDPASKYVAFADAIGITVEVSNLTPLAWGRWTAKDNVSLQYRTKESQLTNLEMTTRKTTPKTRQKAPRSNLYSANLVMGQTPTQYRIVAGDAATRWNTLTPQSRPSVRSFSIEYDYPTYCQLPNKTVQQEHGDLRAIAGTTATVIVEFDEPVSNAVFRFGNQRNEMALDPLNGSTTRFQTSFSIESPRQYQVDAVSLRSNLSNPHSRRYSIGPLADSAPMVRWAQSLSDRRVVSPIELVSLSARITDDVPIDRLLQKSTVNGKALAATPIALDKNKRQHEVSMQWDLSKLDRKLFVGDVVQTRLVAIDRRGQMSDSETLEFLVAEEGFDSQRHDSLFRLYRLSNSIRDWINQAKPATQTFNGDSKVWDTLPSETGLLVASIEKELEVATNAKTSMQVDLAEPLEQIGKAIIDWRCQMKNLRFLKNHTLPDDAESIRQAQSQQLVRQFDLIDENVRALFSHAMTVALVGDALSMRKSISPLLDSTTKIPMSNYGRYLKGVSYRLSEIESLIQVHSNGLQESTFRHIEDWRDWSDQWIIQLDDLADTVVVTDDERMVLEKRLASFDTELQYQTRHSLLDGQLASTIVQTTRELDRTTQTVGEATAGLVDLMTVDEVQSDPFPKTIESLIEKISSEVSLHRKLPSVDLRYAADLNLLKRAIQTVSDETFVDTDGTSTKQLYQRVASAIELLTAAHRVEAGRRQILSLALAERPMSDNAVSRIDHPVQLERFSTRMEHTVGLFKKSDINWSLLKPIDQTRLSTDYTQARDRIFRRRWSEDTVQSAERSLAAINNQLKQALTTLSPMIDEARRILLQLAPPISELADVAVDQPEHKAMIDKSKDVVEALHDFANTADLIDPEQRVLANDADLAAAQILSAATKETLADVLRATADHFRNIESGESLTQSRDQLRRLQQETNLDDDLNQLGKRAESIADAAAKSPSELLDQLEQRLQRNETMQNELDQITDRLEQTIRSELEELRDDENQINQRLESSDPEIRERKIRVKQETVAINRKLNTIQEALVAGAQRSSNWGNLDQVRESLAQVQRELKKAQWTLGKVKREDATLDAMGETSKRVKNMVADIGEIVGEVADQAEAESENNIHQIEIGRRQQQQQLQRFERDARRRQISGERLTETLWKTEQNSAKQRANQSNRLRSDFQRQAKRLRQAAAKMDAAKIDADSEPQQPTEKRKKQLDVLQEQAADAERAFKAAKESQTFAEQRIGQVTDDRKRLERERLEPLDKPNPAAQLTQRMVSKAKQQLRSLETLLDEVTQEMDASDDLSADPKQTQALVQQQSKVTNNLQQAADDLRRIARHQQRMEKMSQAKDLFDVVDLIEQGAKIASENAESDLRETSKSPERSPQANRQIATTAQEISNAFDKLSVDGALETDADDIASQEDSPNQSSRTDQSSRTAQQLAQTLDELDQSIHQTDSMPKSAGEASQTLLSALELVAQQIARRRQQSSLQQSGQSSSNQNVSSLQRSGAKSESNGEESGNEDGEGQGMPGVPPDGTSVPIDGVDLQGSQWGQLRSRRDEDAGQTKRALIPDQYRREIEAYFRVIAKQRGASR